MTEKRVKEKLVLKKSIRNFISRVMICIIIFLLGMILVKSNSNNKNLINEKLYQENIPVMKLRGIYEKYLGNILTIKKDSNEQAVFQEKLSYEKKEKYLDGVKLTVSNDYMVPALESGVVVFLGEKDKYGNTMIIEQIDGIDTFYGNIDINNFKLYDYIEKGELIGEVKDNNLYLVFQKKGKVLDYQKYI